MQAKATIAMRLIPFYFGQTLRGGSAVAKNTSRKLAAILAADVVGHSRLVGENKAR